MIKLYILLAGGAKVKTALQRKQKEHILELLHKK